MRATVLSTLRGQSHSEALSHPEMLRGLSDLPLETDMEGRMPFEKRRASWVSDYALTNDYATKAAHFVRRHSRLVQEVPGRSFFGQRREAVLAGTGVEYPWTMQRTLFDEITAAKGDDRISSRRRRAAIVPVRLTEGERDQLAEVARDLGISLSTYMRQAILSRPLPQRRAVRPIPEVNRETYHALGRLVADVRGCSRRGPRDACRLPARPGPRR